MQNKLEPENYDYPNPGEKGYCLFRVWKLSDSNSQKTSGYCLWDDIDVISGYGGGYHSVQEGIGIDYYLDSIGFTGNGFYVIEGITETFTKDYYGEVDGETFHDEIRKARIPEILCGEVNARWKDIRFHDIVIFLKYYWR